MFDNWTMFLRSKGAEGSFKVIEGPSFFAVSNEPNSYLRVEDDVLIFTTKEQAQKVCDALNQKVKINCLGWVISTFCIGMSLLNFVLYFQGRFDSVYLALCLEFFIIVPCLIFWMEGGK
jgi:hypothetical protein